MEEESKTAKDSPPTSTRKTREVSRYTFPYYNLEVCIEVARALHDRAGGKASMTQLASYLDHTDEFSGAFRSKVWGAKLFGLVQVTSNIVSTTPLGEQLASLQSGLQRDRRLAEAFLNVPLFREVYKRYEGSTLPSTREGLKNALHNTFGVPPRIVPVALKTLLMSADQAGFRRENPNRLIHPIPIGLIEDSRESEPTPKAGGVEITEMVPQKETMGERTHPAISGFLLELPKSEEEWTDNERQRWIDAFVAMVKALYPTYEEKAPKEESAKEDEIPF